MKLSAASYRPSAARGFSLVELMIAIMILGLGMVMVATVFPVSLDLTRSTLQINIGDAAFESAVSTLELRLPSKYLSMEPYPPDNEAAMVLWPDTFKIEFFDPQAPAKTPAQIDTDEDKPRYPYKAPVPVVGEQTAKFAFPGSDWGFPKWDVAGTYLAPQSAFATCWMSQLTPEEIEKFKRFSRPFTESTFWDSELGDRQYSWVIASQNLQASNGELVPESGPVHGLPYIQNPSATIDPRWPAIHLADRVYPPTGVSYDSGTGYYYDAASGLVFDDSAPENDRYVKLANFVATAAREKRYAWTAFTRQGGNSLQEFQYQKRTFLCTIALIYRGDLNARYARQDQPTSDRQFDFSDTNDFDKMRLPQPDTVNGPISDTIFPQPWLVVLDSVNPRGGSITCTGAVAQLLPTNSWIIVAQTNGTKLLAGTPLKITGVPDRIELLNQLYTLEISRFDEDVKNKVAVWVFPPPIDSSRSFHGSSPIVGTAIREVTPDWGK